MELRLAVLKSIFSTYNTDAYPLVFFFVAMIFLLIRNQKEQINLLIYEFFGILLLVTPFVGNKILTIGNAREANWTMYGILCAIPLTAYVAVQLLSDVQTKRAEWSVFFIVVLVIGLGLLASGVSLAVAEPGQKVSKTAVAIADTLDMEAEPYVMTPIELAGDLRECSTEIRVFRNESYGELQKDLNLLQSEAEFYGCNYVVLDIKYDNEERMTEYGFFGRTCIDSYVIYQKSF